jgi:hypothetical protein
LTPEFANELSDIREIFEIRSVMRFMLLEGSHPGWAELRRLRLIAPWGAGGADHGCISMQAVWITSRRRPSHASRLRCHETR